VAKKATSSKADRSDPKKNKSLAIRLVLERQPTATTADIIAAVKKDYGHAVDPNRVYMVKTKSNMASDGRPKKSGSKKNQTPMTSAALWVDAIKTARQLLKQTGSVANATAILKAVDG
jgi:ribosomal protein L19E